MTDPSEPADDQWDFYADVSDESDDLPRFVFLNLSLAERAPDPAHAWRLECSVGFTDPSEDGLPTDAEYEALSALEDRLDEEMRRQARAIFAGRVTEGGRRTWTFYAPGHAPLAPVIATLGSEFAAYEFVARHEFDPEWRYYFEVLYPSPAQHQCMMNRNLLHVFEEQGDVPTRRRVVDHSAYFRTAALRAAFVAEVKRAGFECGREFDPEGDEVEEEFPYGVLLQREHTLEADVIDPMTLDLLERAERYGGYYDGWEAPLETDTD